MKMNMIAVVTLSVLITQGARAADASYTNILDLSDWGLSSPRGEMVLHRPSGKMLGVTVGNNTNSYGGVYLFDPASSSASAVLFMGTNGSRPSSGCILDGDDIYGTTLWGGLGMTTNYYAFSGGGVVYKMNVYETNIQVLHYIGTTSDDGSRRKPIIAGDQLILIHDLNGIYGNGFARGIDKSTGMSNWQISFNGTNGSWPSDMTLGTNGNVYLLTRGGGTANAGVIVEINPSNGAYSVVCHLGSTNSAGFAIATGPDGNLYGTTLGGPSGSSGILFKYVIGSSSITPLWVFTDSETSTVAEPKWGLDNCLYLTAFGPQQYGVNSTNRGYICRYDPVSDTLAVLHRCSVAESSEKPTGAIFGPDDKTLYCPSQVSEVIFSRRVFQPIRVSSLTGLTNQAQVGFPSGTNYTYVGQMSSNLLSFLTFGSTNTGAIPSATLTDVARHYHGFYQVLLVLLTGNETVLPTSGPLLAGGDWSGFPAPPYVPCTNCGTNGGGGPPLP